MRVLIVDDVAVFREAVRELLVLRGYEVVGEAADTAAALAAAERLRPDAVLIDVRLKRESGFDLAAQLRRRRPSPAVLLVSADDDPIDAERVRASGASGLVLKSRLASVDFSAFWPALAPTDPG
jgi:DNA-binding NarL/FixJ family response regulator